MDDMDFSKPPELFLLPLKDRYNKIFKYLISSSLWGKYREKTYGCDFNQLSFIDRKDVDSIIKFGKITAMTKLADIGCGVTKVINYINNKTGAQVHGFDISDFAINYQKNKTDERVEFYVNDLNTIEFKKNFYDVIYLVDSHYFVKDRMKLFDKIYSGLKYNGRMIIITQVFDDEKNNSDIDCLFMKFTSNLINLGYKLVFKKDLIKKLKKMSEKQIKYWNKYKSGLINEISLEIWDAFNWEHHWTKNMLENKRLKRYFLVFGK